MERKHIWLFEIIIWLLIFSAVFLFFVYKTQIKTNDKNTYYLFFDDAGGLVNGSPVRLTGINIGYVKIVKIFDNKVFVAFKVTKKNTEIPKCAIATIEFYGLGGSTSLELNPSKSLYCGDTKEEIIPSKSYRIQDYWNGSALDARVLIDIYGGFGRNVKNEDIIKYKPYIFQSGLIREIVRQTQKAAEVQNTAINRLTENAQKYMQNNENELLNGEITGNKDD